MTDGSKYTDILNDIKEQGAELERLAADNQLEASLKIRDKVRQIILDNIKSIDQGPANLFSRYIDDVHDNHADLIYSSETDQGVKDAVREGGFWGIETQGKILKGINTKNLQDIFRLYDLAHMFILVEDDQDIQDLAETLRAMANKEIENYETDSYSEQKAIVAYLAEKLERIIEVLPTVTDEDTIKDKHNTLNISLRTIFKYDPNAEIKVESFADSCDSYLNRILGYIKLESITKISFYTQHACHALSILKAQIILNAAKLSEDDKKVIAKVVTRIQNMKEFDEAKNKAFATYTLKKL